MDTFPISAKPRHLAGSDIAVKIRRAGLLPAVIYGNGQPATSIAVEPKAVKRGLQTKFGRNQIFQIKVGDAPEQLAIAKEVQQDPLSKALTHVDFMLVTPTSRIEVILPVNLSGRSLGQKAGGRLEHITRYVRVACTPETLPTSVEIDVSPFENGFVMPVEAMPLPEGVTAVYKRPFKILELFAVKIEEKVEEKKPAGKK